MVYIKTDNIYLDIAEDVETRFNTSNYELYKILPKGKNKKVTGLMKNELGGKIMKKFLRFTAKTYSYLIDDGTEDKKAKDTTKYVIKRKHKFGDYENCLEEAQIENEINHLEKKIDRDSLKEDYKEFIWNNKLILKTQQRFRSEKHNIFTEEVNKIAVNLNDDKRMQSIDSIETDASGMNKDLVFKKEGIK